MIALYPNPARYHTIIENQSTGHFQRLLVYNIAGQIVWDERLEVSPKESKAWNIPPKLPGGLYFMAFFVSGEDGQVQRAVKPLSIVGGY